jgi:hypothetical protein
MARLSLEGIDKEATLDALFRFAAVCPSQEAFLERLAQETKPPRPTSTRRSRKR